MGTGALTQLPLHAAGEHPDPLAGTPAGACALDQVVSSYTPTLRSLLHHRTQVAQAALAGRSNPDDPGPALVIALPTTPDAAPLPGADAEAALLTGDLWPGAQILRDDGATRAAVLAALPGHRRVHFACHAVGAHTPTGQPVLLLHDHLQAPLTLTDIAELHLADADFAYLSACETSAAVPTLADEGVHLTGAFHLAGFHHVVGTLWPAADDVAARTAQTFHRALIDTGTAGSARALHQAVQNERRTAPAVPTLWSGHLHTGI